MSDIVAVDVGGTTTKAARYERDGSVVAVLELTTTRTVAAVAAVVEQLRSPRTVGVGVVVPGVIDGGIVAFSANLGWRDVALRDELEARLALPVAIEHDVTAAALAECAGSPGPVLFLALGTGVACAHVVDGVVGRGATGRAGEIGHAPVRPDGIPCACGQFGCLEAYASGAAIARRYRERTNGVERDAAAIAGRLDTDADAAYVWSDAVDALAIALATETLVFDPAEIVIGGGLATAGEVLLGPVRRALAGRLAWRPAPPVRAARLGALAGRAGAARLAWTAAQLAPAAKRGRA